MSNLSIGKHATKHYKAHKLTSILMAILIPIFLYGLMCAVKGEYTGFMTWIGSLCGAITLLAFITVGLYHSRLGMSEVIMDYASSEASAAFLLKLSSFACFVFWALGVASILKIGLTSGLISGMGA